LYGCGLHFKDIDLERSQVAARQGKDEKDRLTMLPASPVEPLKVQIAFVNQQHEHDLANGYGSIELPYPLGRNYSNTDKELSWQYRFASDRLSTDPCSGITRRHSLDTSGLQQAVKTAAKLAKINKIKKYKPQGGAFASIKILVYPFVLISE
jgi:hypothetical protein